MSSRNHSYFQDLLELHISGAPLPPEDRLNLFDHIETCDQCRQMLEAEERLTARMKTIPRMVAPSDLRSKILSQAMRDHTERTTTPSEDPHIADILVSPPQETPASGPSKQGVGPAHPHEDLPFFPEIQPPRTGSFRRAWRKASPALATSFLVIASVGALYTGQFQGIPVANQAQQLVWSVVDSALNREDVYPPQTTIAGTTDDPVTVLPANPDAGQFHPTIENESTDAASNIGLRANADPLPGTVQLTEYITETRAFFRSVDSTAAALARATKEEIPAPAEDSAPQIAALVIKATDPENTVGGFRSSELAEALEAVARSQPGGRLSNQDQFAMDGHRYRLYTLELPAGCTNRLVETLTPYQAATDRVVVNALASQEQIPSRSGDKIRFFSGNQARLRTALENITPVSVIGNSERIRVVVVE